MHHPAHSISKPLLLALEGISRRFGSIWANRNISMDIMTGEIHAIVGENGAGKSTLMKILYGEIRPDSGRILLNGETTLFKSPKDAMHAGIGMLHQQPLIFPQLSLLENILVGHEGGKWGFVSAEKGKVQDLCRSLGFDLPLQSMAGVIPFAQRQQIELVRVLHRGAKILILDEPTSLLAPSETAGFLNLLKSLRSQGYTIIFISHRINEVLEVADRISVLRNGECTATVRKCESTMDQVARLILTGTLSSTPPAPAMDYSPPNPSPPASSPPPGPFLEMRGVTVRAEGDQMGIEDFSLSIGRGEAMGIGSVVGNGERALARVLAGITSPFAGRISLGGADITRSSIGERRDMGIRWLPANPLEESLLPDRPIWENILLGWQRSPAFQKRGRLQKETAIRSAKEQLEDGGVVSPDVAREVFGLSGGNQQKIALLRALACSPKLVILEQPGRGLDIRAQDHLRQTVRSLCDKGVTLLIISHDLDELLSTWHRIGILYRGSLMGIVERYKASRRTLGNWMLGLKGDGFDFQ